MRILLAHDYGTLNGGAEVMVTALRDALRSRGHEALLFTSSARPLPLPLASDEQCFGTVSPLRRVLQVANPHAVARLRRVLARFAPEVVHVKMFLTQLSPLILPLLRARPSLLHVINYNLICPVNTKTLPNGVPCHQRAGAICHAAGCVSWPGVARTLVQRRLTSLDVFDRVVASSRWIADRLRAEGLRVDGCVANGVPVTRRRPALGEVPVVGYAGRLIAKKGVDVLLRAMAQLLPDVRMARLVVAGDGPERGALQRLASELGISASTDFRGHLPQERMEQALGSAWVQAVPSRWEEPFGLVAAEAMMRGTAVVASEHGGLGEQVVQGETGYLVRPGDPAALATVLRHVLCDRDLAEHMGAAGRRRALAELSLDRHVDRFEDTYGEIIASRAR